MAGILEALSVVLQLIGGFFFFAGTIGVLRFPDALTRLHALTKADNLGLGFIVLGLALTAGSVYGVAILIVIWVLSMAASTTACQMIAQAAVFDQRRARRRA